MIDRGPMNNNIDKELANYNDDGGNRIQQESLGKNQDSILTEKISENINNIEVQLEKQNVIDGG